MDSGDREREIEREMVKNKATAMRVTILETSKLYSCNVEALNEIFLLVYDILGYISAYSHGCALGHFIVLADDFG